VKEFLFLLDGMKDMQCFRVKADNKHEAFISACRHLYLDDELFMENLDQIVLIERDEIDDEADHDAFKKLFIKKVNNYFGEYKESAQAYVDFILADENEIFVNRQIFIDVSEEFLLKEYMEYIEKSYKILDLDEIKVI